MSDKIVFLDEFDSADPLVENPALQPLVDWVKLVKLALNDSVEVIYESNNSGGVWWLNDTDWKKLEEAGWHLEDHGLGVTWRATKTFPSLRAGVEEWEKVTGMDSAAKGCPCCGQPHGFLGEDTYGNTLFWPE